MVGFVIVEEEGVVARGAVEEMLLLLLGVLLVCDSVCELVVPAKQCQANKDKQPFLTNNQSDINHPEIVQET